MIVMKTGSTPKKVNNPEEFINRWRPVDGWLIADKKLYVLPTHHSEFGNAFYYAYCKKVKSNLLAILLCGFFLIAVLILKPVDNYQNHLVILTLILAFAIVDNILCVRSINSCRQKVEFLYNFKGAFELTVFPLAMFMCGIFLTQWIMELNLGGLEPLVKLAGNYYPVIQISSYWRFVTGSLIHGDFQHWLLNSILTILFASTIPNIKPTKTIIFLITGAAISHCTTFIVNAYSASAFDCLLGISGGTFFLLGYSIAVHLQLRSKSTAVTLLAVMTISEISLLLLSVNTSHVAHLSGFASGIAYALLKPLKLTYPFNNK